MIRPWGALIAAGLALFLAVLTFAPQLDPEIDSADYTVLGQSLRLGQGLRYIYLPDAPRANKLPVGFPLLLAGVEWVAPGSLVARKVLIAACYVGAVALTFRLALSYVAPLPAFLVAVLTALNPFVLGMARLVMSEIPYLFVSLLALCLLERALRGPGPAPWWAWGGGLAALLAAAQVRTIGWSLLLAFLLVLLLQRRYRALLGVLLGVGLLLGVLALGGVGPVGSRYVEIWEERMTAPAASGPEGVTAVSRMLTSALSYGWLVIPAAFLPIPLGRIPLTTYTTLPSVVPGASGSTWAFVFQALLAGLCLLVLTLGAWPVLKRARLTPYYTAAFLAILLIWPPEFSWARMVVPVIPCLFLFGAIGLDRLWTRARPRVPALNRGLPVLVSALLLSDIWGVGSLGALDQEHFPEWTEFLNAAEWIRTHSDPRDLILTDFPAHLYTLTGRKADFLFRRRRGGRVQVFETFEHLLEHIDATGARYLLDDGISLTTEDLKGQLFAHVAEAGSRWRVAYRGRGNGVYVRRDRPIETQPSEGAARARSE